jgi:hypothetical protein
VRGGLYAIDMPVTGLLEYTGVGGHIVSEFQLQVEDWPGLRRDVREGQEIVLVGSVLEAEAVIQLHAIVIEFDDSMRLVKVVA